MLSLRELEDYQLERALEDPVQAMARDRSILEDGLYECVKAAWPHVESVPYIDNWHVEAICRHLQAVTQGIIPKLLINVPPGTSKSLLTSVFWPAWEWATDPTVRWFFASYDQRLSTRDSVRCRTLIDCKWYQQRWPVKLKGDQNQKTYYETTKGGYRLSSSVGGHSTGEHPMRIVVADANSVKESESKAAREEEHDWWTLTMPPRGLSLNARRVGIQQRTHEDDFSGLVLKEGDWCHICLPMRYERDRMRPTPLGWTDPRTTEAERLAPIQFPEDKVHEVEKTLSLVHGAYGIAGKLHQRPTLRKGGM